MSLDRVSEASLRPSLHHVAGGSSGWGYLRSSLSPAVGDLVAVSTVVALPDVWRGPSRAAGLWEADASREDARRAPAGPVLRLMCLGTIGCDARAWAFASSVTAKRMVGRRAGLRPAPCFVPMRQRKTRYSGEEMGPSLA